MKKLMLLAAMLAMVLVAVAPAIAQVDQSSEQENKSGDATQTFTVTGSGASANQCAAILAAAQSGNGVNSTGVIQANSDGNKVEVGKSGNLAVSPEISEECEQKTNQTAVAATSKAASAPAPAPKATPQAKAEEKKTEEKKAEEKKAEEKKELPKSGGSMASLFALGTGALLVAGGLLARRIIK